MRDDRPVVGRADLRAHLLRELCGITLIDIGDCDEVDGGMIGGKPRSQRANAAGPNYRDPELFAFDDIPLALPRLFDLEIQRFDHFAPLRRFSPDELRKFLRRIANRLGAEPDEALLHLR